MRASACRTRPNPPSDTRAKTAPAYQKAPDGWRDSIEFAVWEGSMVCAVKVRTADSKGRQAIATKLARLADGRLR